MHTACTPEMRTPCTRHAQVHQLCEAAAYLPEASLRFHTLSDLLRYFGSRRFALVWTLTPTPPLSLTLTLTSTFYPRQLLPRLTPTLPLPLTAQPTTAGSAPEVEADPVGSGLML